MIDISKNERTCKIYNKAENKYLHFESEYDLNECCINFADENDVDLSNYETQESRTKNEANDQEWFKFSKEHLLICEDHHCITLKAFRIENGVKI